VEGETFGGDAEEVDAANSDDVMTRSSRAILWTAVLGGLGVVFAAAYGVHAWVRARDVSTPSELPIRVESGIIKLGVKRAELNGLKDQPAEAVQWSERLTIYGQIVPNPRASIDIRLPFAGTLRSVSESGWPGPGEWVKAGQVLGRLEVRIGPQDRLDWQSKLSEARQKEQGAAEVVKIEQARVERFKSSGSADIVSRRELDDALVRLAEAKTQLATAQAAVKLWQEALAASEKPENGPGPWSRRVTAPADGEVTELLARPGTQVEAGTVVARLVDFRRLLARLDLPPDALGAGPTTPVTLSVLGRAPAALSGVSNRPESASAGPFITATLAGAAPQIDAASQLASYWYEATSPPPEEQANNARLWRPGLYVKSEVPLPDRPQKAAVVVPASAVLFHQGRALVYVRLDPGRYERREVQLLGRDNDRWVLASGVKAGDLVVYEQAQVLLSQEFNADTD
jgi:RND family efflux transporter MFP subunit